MPGAVCVPEYDAEELSIGESGSHRRTRKWDRVGCWNPSPDVTPICRARAVSIARSDGRIIRPVLATYRRDCDALDTGVWVMGTGP